MWLRCWSVVTIAAGEIGGNWTKVPFAGRGARPVRLCQGFKLRGTAVIVQKNDAKFTGVQAIVAPNYRFFKQTVEKIKD